MLRPTPMPITVANAPRVRVLASAFLSSGHTGRLPLIERPQSPVTKWPSQRTYCSGVEPTRPFTSR